MSTLANDDRRLTPELLRLMEHEKVIEQGLQTFYEVGQALVAIRDGRQWGSEYRDLHARAWFCAVDLLRSGGRFVLNLKDHVRNGALQLVSHWHVAELSRLGLVLNVELSRSVGTPTIGLGANADARKLDELVLVFDKSTEGPA